MTMAISPGSTVIALPPVITVMPSPSDATVGALPGPLLNGLEPGDALALLLVSMEKSAQASMTATEDKVRATRENIKEQLDSYLEQLRQALEAANEDDGGWFSDIVDCVSNVIGAVVGAVADVWCDFVTLPADLMIHVTQAIAQGQNVWAALQSDMEDFGRTGEAGKVMKGFTRGVVAFAGELAGFGAKLAAALAIPGVTSDHLWETMRDDFKLLANKFDKHILSNPDFWTVVGTAAKVLAVAGTLASGGVLGGLCVALIALNELDQRTGFVQELVGEDAAPWLRTGLQLAAAVCGGLAGGGSSQIAQRLQTATEITQGVGTVGRAIKKWIDSEHNADQVDRQANMMETLNRMRQFQRLCDELIDVLTNKNKDHSTYQEQANELVQTFAAGDGAAIMRA